MKHGTHGRLAMKQSSFDIDHHFTYQELKALKAFYARIPARQIRPLYGDPWPLVARHRGLPKDHYEAVKAALEYSQIDKSDD
jgi:hypothetical protein